MKKITKHRKITHINAGNLKDEEFLDTSQNYGKALYLLTKNETDEVEKVQNMHKKCSTRNNRYKNIWKLKKKILSWWTKELVEVKAKNWKLRIDKNKMSETRLVYEQKRRKFSMKEKLAKGTNMDEFRSWERSKRE